MRNFLMAATGIIFIVSFPLKAVEISSSEGPVRFSIDGQVRVRSVSHSGLDFKGGTEYEVFTQRTRLGLRADIEETFSIYVQLQDVRTWGEEMDTLKDYSGDSFDFHQAYAQVNLPLEFTLRSGRQEIFLENHRLVGNVAWTDQARSFDGFRLLRTDQDLDFNAFFTKIVEPDSPLVGSSLESEFYGAHVNWHSLEWVSLGGYYLVQDNSNIKLTRNTYGAIAKVKAAGLRAHGEYYLQEGEFAKLDISASLASVGVGWEFDFAGKPGIYLYGDWLSGDDNPTDRDFEVFDTLFATNHKFYGFMDLFITIPAHTGGLGIVDQVVRVYGNVGDRIKLSGDYHWMSLSEEDVKGDTELGQELDLTLKATVAKGLSIQAGYSYFDPDDSMENMKGDDVSEHWSYLMASFVF